MRAALKFSAAIMVGAAVLAAIERAPGLLRDPIALSAMVLGVALTSALVFGGASDRGVARSLFGGLSLSVAALVALALLGANRETIGRAGAETLSRLQPSQPVALSATEVLVTRERSGHFAAVAEIDGVAVHMLVDTGSTDIALPYDEARRIGIDMDALVFDQEVATANGRARMARIRLDEVSVGSVTLTGVQASVAEPGRLRGALLGMSFLGRLSEITIRGDTLVLVR